MNRIGKSILAIAVIGLLFGCEPRTTPEEVLDARVGFVTKLGVDTLALELFEKKGDQIVAQVLLRSPETLLREYRIKLNDNGGMETMEATYYKKGSLEKARIDKYAREGDSLKIERWIDDSTRYATVAAPENVLPFIDMVHWPFDIMLKNAYMAGADVQQPLISGNRVMNFELVTIDADSMTAKHPSRGTMGVTVTEEGELKMLEAGQTTRALTVQRIAGFDMAEYGKKFINRPFGPLSGRGQIEATVLGANFTGDFGTPSKRGREIWGALVRYGQRWRTGANRATHFSTDKGLNFDGTIVPAGDYTLFTIPEADGGTLIINKQTGQNGRSYDEAQDQARIPLTFQTLDSEVEVFNITVDEVDGSGLLRLQWGSGELVASFMVEN